MFSTKTFALWIGIILISGTFLMGQESWPPQDCLDGDGDGYGSPASVSCAHPGFDCDDGNPDVHPGVPEICDDGVDNDCDGDIDMADSGCLVTDAIIADHSAAADFGLIPESSIEQAKVDLRIAYGHTSHGSQIVSGMAVLMGLDPLYSYSTSGGTGVLSLHDRTPSGDSWEPGPYHLGTENTRPVGCARQ
jgi:hypothetical protein